MNKVDEDVQDEILFHLNIVKELLGDLKVPPKKLKDMDLSLFELIEKVSNC